MTRDLHKLAALLACATLGLGACASEPETASEPQLALWFAGLSSASCVATGSGSGNLPDDITTLALSLTSPGAAARIVRTSRAALAGKASWLVKLPVTQGLDLEAYGCDKDKKVVWMGRSNGFAIENQKETKARVFLAPVGKLACAGSVGGSALLQAPRSLGGSATLPSGDAIVLGGIKEWIVASATGTGSNATDTYDHRAGVFQKGPDLLAARIQPHAFALPAAPGSASATKVLVIGGASTIVRYNSVTGLMAPDKVDAASLPQVHAEVLDLAAGSGSQGVAYAGDVGVGWRAFSAAVASGSDLVLVGGLDDQGAALAEGTRIQNIADITAGGTAQTAKIKLATARKQPGLATFGDGTVVVWGGATSKAATDMGELIVPGEVAGRALALSGPTDLIQANALSTVGPAIAVLSSSADSLVLLVAGGMPLSSPTTAIHAKTYAVTITRSTLTAVLKAVQLPQGLTLRAGLGAAATRLPGGQWVFAGGLIALNSTPEICATGAECILDAYTVIETPTDLGAATLDLKATQAAFDGPRFGMTALAIPSGALLAGGQTSVNSAGSTLLIDVGQVLAWAPGADVQAKVCGQ